MNTSGFFLLPMLLLVLNSDALDRISFHVLQTKIVPFMNNRGTKTFGMAGRRYRRVVKNRIDEMTIPLMMYKFGEAIVAMDISVEQFMHNFRRCDDFSVDPRRLSHTTVAYSVSDLPNRCELTIRLKPADPLKRRLTVLTVQMHDGKFEGCLLSQNDLYPVFVRSVAIETCRQILRAAYWGKEFSIPGIEDKFIIGRTGTTRWMRRHLLT